MPNQPEMIPPDAQHPGLALESPVRVRYVETDAQGIVHHSAYIPYLEIARTDFMRRLGFPYVEMERDGLNLSVVDLHLRYRQSARYDDLLRVSCWVERMTHVSVTLGYTVLREADDATLATGNTKLACVDRATGRPRRLPRAFAETLQRVRNPDSR